VESGLWAMSTKMAMMMMMMMMMMNLYRMNAETTNSPIVPLHLPKPRRAATPPKSFRLILFFLEKIALEGEMMSQKYAVVA